MDYILNRLINKLKLCELKYINEEDDNEYIENENSIDKNEYNNIESDDNLNSLDNNDLTNFNQLEEEPLSKSELGKAYELKKIYIRLTTLELFLSNDSHPELLDIQKNIHQAIKLFDVILSNFDAYKEKINDIIIMYYKFINEIYKKVKQFYAKKNKER
jgi:hypothetical protein